MAWNPFGVAFELTATGSNVIRKSATQFTVKINAAWETYYSGAETNYGMKASSGGGSVTLNPSGTYASSGSGSFTGTYSISGNASATKTITVTFTNYLEDWQGNVEESKTTTVTFNVSVPAWCTLSYSANGGSGAPSSQSTAYNGNVTISSTKPTRTGFTFLGWSTSSTATSASYSGGDSYKLTKDTTLYAVWREHKLTVNYYSNYATSAFEDTLNTVGSDKNVKVWTYDFYYNNDYTTYGLANYSNSSGSVYMTRTGYTGTGYWGTSTSGGTLINENTGYNTGQVLAKALGKDLSNGDASINLYAQWKINSYKFVYNPNGGSGSMSDQSVNWNSNFVLSDNAFKREGYKFVGWNAYRNDDNTWYVYGSGLLSGWFTEDEIVKQGYGKKLYPNQDELIFDNSWIKGNEDSISQYTMYAVWEISGVVYIDNGTSLEPYLAYIDNGSNWDLYLAYIDNGTDWDIIS